MEVAGHTDSTGSDDYNLNLSQRRANTVGEYLYTQGIMDQRIITVGMGEHHPVADNGTSGGRQMNRRVEITLVPVTAGLGYYLKQQGSAPARGGLALLSAAQQKQQGRQ